MRALRIIIIMLFLLLTISIGAAKTDAYSKCNVPIAARYDYFSNHRLYGCISITSKYNLDAYALSCQWTSIGVTISNVSSYEYVQWVNGERTIVVGCKFTKGLFWVPGGATTCWVEATIRPWYYQGYWRYSVGPSRSNWC